MEFKKIRVSDGFPREALTVFKILIFEEAYLRNGSSRRSSSSNKASGVDLDQCVVAICLQGSNVALKTVFVEELSLKRGSCSTRFRSFPPDFRRKIFLPKKWKYCRSRWIQR